MSEEALRRESANAGRGIQTPEVKALLAYQGARAREYYVRARASLPSADAGRLIAAEIMGAIYRAILSRIERRDYDVFSEVVSIPRPRRAARDRGARPVTRALAAFWYIWDVMDRLNLSLIAAGVGFFAMLSLFPALAAIVLLWSWVADPAQINYPVVIGLCTLLLIYVTMVYGPIAENFHAIDERVSLSSLLRVTQTIALLAAEWCGTDVAR